MSEPIRRDLIDVPDNDDLAKDLLDLLSDAGVTDEAVRQAILLRLVPYIVRRDHKVFNHAYHVGRASV